MPGDISRSYKGPKDGSVPSWMDEPSPSTLPKPGVIYRDPTRNGCRCKACQELPEEPSK